MEYVPSPTVPVFTSLPTAAVDTETPIEPLTSAPTKTVTVFAYPPTAAADSFFQPTSPPTSLPTSMEYVPSPTVPVFTSLPTAAVDTETPIEPLTSAPTKTVTVFA